MSRILIALVLFTLSHIGTLAQNYNHVISYTEREWRVIEGVMEQKTKRKNVLTIRIVHEVGTIDTIRYNIPYEVYQFQSGDVDGDGVHDILIGIVERKGKTATKNIMMLQLLDGTLRRVPLGLRIAGLQTFSLVEEQKRSRIRAVQKRSGKKYDVALYEWSEAKKIVLKEWLLRSVSRATAMQDGK